MSDTATRDERRTWVLANRTHEEVTEDLLDREDQLANAKPASPVKGYARYIGAFLGVTLGWFVANLVVYSLVDLLKGGITSESAIQLAEVFFTFGLLALGGFIGYRIGLAIEEN